jgi:hypothetical protein
LSGVAAGTPLQNDLKEFYAIVNLVSPGSLGSAGSFSRNFEDPIVRSKQPEATAHEIDVGEEKAEELGHLTSQVGVVGSRPRGFVPNKRLLYVLYGFRMFRNCFA